MGMHNKTRGREAKRRRHICLSEATLAVRLTELTARLVYAFVRTRESTLFYDINMISFYM